jgi:hypothetical protein
MPKFKTTGCSIPDSALGEGRLARNAVADFLYDCLKAVKAGAIVAIDPRCNPFVFMAKQCGTVILRNTGLSQPVANRV